jgi:hypothetical protein
MQKKLSPGRTQQILDHFEEKRNILDRCRTAVEKLKRQLPIKVRKSQAKRCK